MNELYESVDYNNLRFEYPTKNVRFYEYMDSKKLFKAIKNNRLKFNDGLKRQEELLNKINDEKQAKNILNRKKGLIILINFTIPEKKFLFFQRL